MLYHARQPHSGINGDRPTPRGDSEGRKPWRAFCGGIFPRQLACVAQSGEQNHRKVGSRRFESVRTRHGGVAQLGERALQCCVDGDIVVRSGAPWRHALAKYKFVKAPPEYPGKVYSWGRRLLEHRLVWWNETGHVVGQGEVVHHLNGDGSDNRFENLQLLTVDEHNEIHHMCDAPVEFVCPTCSTPFVRSARYVRTRTNRGAKTFYCSRRCGVTGTGNLKKSRFYKLHRERAGK